MKRKYNYKKKPVSPFSREFWIAKGYSVEEADYERNSRRPIRKEYWIKKGYSEEEAIQMAIDTKISNNKKGAEKLSMRSDHDIRMHSHRCIEFYTSRGFTEEEGKKAISKLQSTFSLEKCILKYGKDDGIKRWNARQEKWLSTIKERFTGEDLVKFNASKNAIIIKEGENLADLIDRLNSSRGMKIVGSLDELVEIIEGDVREYSDKRYRTVDSFIEYYVPKIQCEIVGGVDKVREAIKHLFIFPKNFIFLPSTNNRSAFPSIKMWTDKGLLRSSYEIYFYEKVIEILGDDIESDMMIDKQYPNSNFRYDFLMPNGDYVEICPMMEKYEDYTLKMEKKKKLFSCILLKNEREINEYINNYKCNY